MPKGVYVHKLSNINKDTMTADCAECGDNISLRLKSGKIRCRKALNDYKRKKNYSIGKHGLRYYVAKEITSQSACEICGTTENLVIDHCHTSNNLRGVLCSQHNTALGLFRDSIEHMTKAIEYLTNPPGVDVGNHSRFAKTGEKIG